MEIVSSIVASDITETFVTLVKRKKKINQINVNLILNYLFYVMFIICNLMENIKCFQAQYILLVLDWI